MPEEKTLQGIRTIFNSVPTVYEKVNHILTMGLDIYWRRTAAKMALKGIRSGRLLDVCSGTGEMARYLGTLSQKDSKVEVVSLDFCAPMLHQAIKKPPLKNISFCVADAGVLPFADNTFDCLTISFATRNLNRNKDVLLDCFREFYRVLKPGGKFVNLETSQPQVKFIRSLFHFYVRIMVGTLGSLLSGSKAAYRYLAYTIPRFFCADELTGLLQESGFTKVNLFYLAFGISAIHIATK